MEKKEYAEKFASFGLWALVKDISDDGDGQLQLTADGELLSSELEQELDKAREEGFIDGGRWMQDLEYEISGQFDVYEEVEKYKKEISELKE